jgi:hypothetical protein
MAWEKRSSTGTRYFTKSHRVNGKVKRDYIGSLSQDLVEVLARQDRLSTAEQRAQRQTRKDEVEQYKATEAALKQHWHQLCKVVDYWLRIRRYRRGRNKIWEKAMRVHATRDERRQPLLTKDEFDALLRSAEKGNFGALTKIRELFNGDRETWRPFGDLTEHVKTLFLTLIAKNNLVLRESLKIRLDELVGELDQGCKSPVKKLIVGAVSMAWLDYHYAQALVAESSNNMAHAEQLERRLSRSQKRYFESLDFLERIQQLPSSENAEQQDN